jgi:integrase
VAVGIDDVHGAGQAGIVGMHHAQDFEVAPERPEVLSRKTARFQGLARTVFRSVRRPQACLLGRLHLPGKIAAVFRAIHRQEILSADDVRELLAAAWRLPPAGSLRPATSATLLRLLHSTGMRIGEALALDVGVLDFIMFHPEATLRPMREALASVAAHACRNMKSAAIWGPCSSNVWRSW